MTERAIMSVCFMCGEQFQMGPPPHLYDGKYIRRYDIAICRMCYDANWDGWAPLWEEQLIRHLKEKGLEIPERNEKGWLPRD